MFFEDHASPCDFCRHNGGNWMYCNKYINMLEASIYGCPYHLCLSDTERDPLNTITPWAILTVIVLCLFAFS